MNLYKDFRVWIQELSSNDYHLKICFVKCVSIGTCDIPSEIDHRVTVCDKTFTNSNEEKRDFCAGK